MYNFRNRNDPETGFRKFKNWLFKRPMWQFLLMAGAAFVLLAVGINALSKAYHNYQSGVVQSVCSTYYTANMAAADADPNTVKVVGNYDSDGDGRGTCDIYKDGKPLVQLQCDSTVPQWMNTGNCKNRSGHAGIRQIE